VASANQFETNQTNQQIIDGNKDSLNKLCTLRITPDKLVSGGWSITKATARNRKKWTIENIEIFQFNNDVMIDITHGYEEVRKD